MPQPHEESVTRAQPKGLYLLFGVEMWERFSYYGMRAMLVLFLINGVAGFGFSKEDATAVYNGTRPPFTSHRWLVVIWRIAFWERIDRS